MFALIYSVYLYYVRAWSIIFLCHGRVKVVHLHCFRLFHQIDIDNVASSEVDFYLSESRKTNGVTQFVKYHYNLVKLLAESFNFT